MQVDYFLGLDLGQRQDYAAIAVVERKVEAVERDWATWEWKTRRQYSLRMVQRFPLGTAYTEIARRVGEGAARIVEERGGCTVVADATGVGGAVMELLRAEARGWPLVEVSITSGDRARCEGERWRVPKKDLIARLQVMLERRELLIPPRLAWGPELMEELRSMRVKVTAAGHEVYGAWREGEHDDLVLAAGLGLWRGTLGEVGERRERLF